MPTQRPSRDWPVRSLALDGTEWFIKQNAIADITPFPKEEMVTTDLIVEKALSDITSFSVNDETLFLNFDNRDSLSVPLDSIRGIYGGDVSGNTITFFENSGDEVSLDLSPLSSPIFVESVSLSGSVVTLHRNDDVDVLLDLAPINDSLLSITPISTSTTQFRMNRENGGLGVSFSANSFGGQYKVSTVTLTNNKTLNITLVNGTTISKNLEYVKNRTINVNISPLNQPIPISRKYKYVFDSFSQGAFPTIRQIGFYLHTAGVSTTPTKKLSLEVKIGTAVQNIYTIDMLSNEPYKFLNLNLYLGAVNQIEMEITVLQNDFTSGDTLPSGLYFNSLYNL